MVTQDTSARATRMNLIRQEHYDPFLLRIRKIMGFAQEKKSSNSLVSPLGPCPVASLSGLTGSGCMGSEQSGP